MAQRTTPTDDTVAPEPPVPTGSRRGDLDGDAALVHGDPLPSARVPLSRERIVAAAVAYIDEHGLTSLSMRRLGTDLGVEAMSLYRYVTGREQLLDAVADTLLAQLHDVPEVVRVPTAGWQDFTQRLAHGMRRIA